MWNTDAAKKERERRSDEVDQNRTVFRLSLRLSVSSSLPPHVHPPPHSLSFAPRMTFGRKTFIAAFALYALVIGCVLWPTQAVPATDEQADAEANAGSVHATLKELPFCGATMQLHDVNNLAGYEKACDEIAGQGGDTVMFVPSASMEDGSSNLIYIDARHTMSEANLRLLIAHAEADKLRVILMPIVLLDAPKGNEWRGTIHPDDWDDWFESYQDMILYYARLAQST